MRWSFLLFLFVFPAFAVAQSLPTYTPFPDPGYPGGAIGPNDYISVGRCAGPGMTPCTGRELNVEALFRYINRNGEALSSMQQQLAAISAQMDRNYAKLAQGIALSSAVTVLPPNPGDRFSVTVGGAGFDNQAAASIAGTARVSENALVYLGYARSASQNLVKGGASFSFH